jgi:CubicO group peptidase (beta-lactamase class C family)
VTKARAEWRAPAVAVSIVKGDSVVFARGYGVLEVGGSRPADEHTLFAIGSSSKAFTTAALAMLVDEGKLRWDDRAAGHLPGWQLADPWVTREITLRDLVAHRVGLDRADAIWGITTLSRDEIMHRQRFIERRSSFRLNYGYNNHMFLAAGMVVATVSGMTWDQFLDTRIFEPLGMRRTNTSVEAFGSDPNVATPHTQDGDAIVAIPWHDIDNIGPAGSVNSSVREMAEWVRLHLGLGEYRGRRLISEAQVQGMHAPETVIPLEPWLSSSSPVNHQMVPGTNFFLYGRGWFLQDYRGRKVVHHGGAIDGMRALVGMMPSEDLGVVILTNLNPSSLDEGIMFRVFDEYLGGATRDWSREMLDGMERLIARSRDARARQEAARVPNTRPSLALASYAGQYADSAYGTATITLEGNRLVLTLGTLTADLEHWHYDTFQAVYRGPTRSDGLVSFELDAAAKPVALVVPGFPRLRRR